MCRRSWLLGINYGAIVFFASCWIYAGVVVSLQGPLRVAALDRAQVFNEERLREFNPELAENIRPNLGRWIPQGERKAAIRFTQLGMLVGVINVVVLHLGRSRPHREGGSLQEKGDKVALLKTGQ